MPDSPGSVCLVVAHPDDEALGAGSQLSRLAPQLEVIYVTDGAPRDMVDAHAYGFETREAYALARRREAHCALEIAGVRSEQAIHLDFVDQEASFHLAGVARRLMQLLERYSEGSTVLTHAYEGGHPDHDAVAFAVHAALAKLQKPAAAPDLYEFALYRAGAGGMITFEFLPSAGGEVTTITLTEEERGRKRRMIDCYMTQSRTLAPFGVEVERLRRAPRYDFTRPPHAPPLHYDHYDWGMRSEAWTRLAGEAMGILGLEGAL